jgi:hypothetical protein
MGFALYANCMKASSSSEPYRTGPQVARHFQVSEATVRRWRKLGCPSYPRGYRLIYYKFSEVDAWLQTRDEEMLSEEVPA